MMKLFEFIQRFAVRQSEICHSGFTLQRTAGA